MWKPSPATWTRFLKFAARAYRRPLSQTEREKMLAYYRSLREKSGLDARRRHPRLHRQRADVAEVLLSHRSAAAARPCRGQGRRKCTGQPLSNYALASRLSYFLWSSMPDEELLAHAAAGDLQKPDVLVAQARRMLKDDRARGLAIEFGGNWLDFRRFEEHNAVDRERFPSFTNELREAMFEEPIRFFDDVIRNDRSVLDLLYGNYTFVNPVLAKHYGMPEVARQAPTSGSASTMRARYGRGGLLPMAVFLTQNAPGLRTSPVKRGYWVVRRVLGETIPPPPPNVPELPQDEAKIGAAAARHAGQASREPGLRRPAMRASTRSAWPSKATDRSARSRAKDLAGRPGRRARDVPRRQRRRRLRGPADLSSASTARTISSTTSAASCWPTRSAGRCCSPTSRSWSACEQALAANGYRFSPLGRDHRHQPAVPEQAKPADRRNANRKVRT